MDMVDTNTNADTNTNDDMNTNDDTNTNIDVDQDNDISNYRNKHDRRHETLNIIYQLKKNNISSDYPAIKQLLQKLNEYVEEGHQTQFTIPFPEMSKKIKGFLPLHKKEKCVVVLKHLE